VIVIVTQKYQLRRPLNEVYSNVALLLFFSLKCKRDDEIVVHRFKHKQERIKQIFDRDRIIFLMKFLKVVS